MLSKNQDCGGPLERLNLSVSKTVSVYSIPQSCVSALDRSSKSRTKVESDTAIDICAKAREAISVSRTAATSRCYSRPVFRLCTRAILKHAGHSRSVAVPFKKLTSFIASNPSPPSSDQLRLKPCCVGSTFSS